VEIGPRVRRVAAPDLAAVESDSAVVAGIRREVERNGPITFARFMELALYDPAGGYYRGASARAGRGGDFLTAPEAHPIFGRSLARHVDDVWRALGRPDPFTVREHGAGGGALGAAILAGLAAESPDLVSVVRYRAVEIEPRRLTELRETFARAGVADGLEDDDGRPIVGMVLANEVLDALPTHRVVQRGAQLHEVYVGLVDDGFADVEAAPSTPALAARLRDETIKLGDGQRAEICLAIDDWIQSAAAGLERGVMALIDYAHPARELYDPKRRPAGTFAAYLRHTVHDDPYRAIGRQDLTAHVDMTAVDRAARRAGLVHLGTTTQGRFLAGLGAGDLLVGLQSGPGSDLQSYLEARASLVRMLDPAAMGGFRVLVFGRGLESGVLLRGLD
jgi:SAM-dependent MidA family methyltransferase